MEALSAALRAELVGAAPAATPASVCYWAVAFYLDLRCLVIRIEF